MVTICYCHITTSSISYMEFYTIFVLIKHFTVDKILKVSEVHIQKLPMTSCGGGAFVLVGPIFP